MSSSQEDKTMRIRASAFLPFSAEQVAAEATSKQVERNDAPQREQKPQPQPTSLDFGMFRTGVPQYSHAHWNVASTGQAAMQARPLDGEQIAADPATLRPDTESLYGEVCSNASSASLASDKSRKLGKTLPAPATTTSTSTSTPQGTQLPFTPSHNLASSVSNIDNLTNTSIMDSPTLRDMPTIAHADSDSDTPASATHSDALATGSISNEIALDTIAIGAGEVASKDSPPPVNPTTDVKDFAEIPSHDSDTDTRATKTRESNDSDGQDRSSVLRSFPLLNKRPPPIITDHPAYGSDPFTSASDSPQIVSSWTPSQIRTYNENQKPETVSPKPKNNLLNLVRANISDPDQEIISLADAAKEGPPPASLAPPPPTPPTPITDRRRTSLFLPRPRAPSSTSTTTTSSTRKFPPFSLRSLAGALTPTTQPEAPQFDRVAYLQKQEHSIRAKTSTLPRANASMFPNHPDTSRNWMHRNLRCTACVDKCCANCGKTCCAWKAAGIALERTHKENEDGVKRALRIREEIEAFDSRGKELPTFLKCSECEEMVCPECCGECCEEICRLVCCRKCKRDPWDVCDYHRDL